MFKRKLKCSFCGKDEDHVAKLVSGPKVFICDECVAIASALMQGAPVLQSPSDEP